MSGGRTPMRRRSWGGESSGGEEREHALAVARARARRGPVGAGHPGARRGARSVPHCASNAISIASSTRVRGAAWRASARSSSRPKTITCAHGSPTRSRSRRSRQESPGPPACACRSSRRSRSRTTAVTDPRATRRKRRSRRTSPAATTMRSTAPTSRSSRSTCASRRSTAFATIRGAGRLRRRPRARSSRGPTASRTSATTSRTRCGPGSSRPMICRPRSPRSSVHGRQGRSAHSSLAVLDAVDATGVSAMTEPAASALAAFRPFNFERIYLRPAGVARPRRSSACSRAWSTSTSTCPTCRLPTATGMRADLAAGVAEAAAVAVRYVAG